MLFIVYQVYVPESTTILRLRKAIRSLQREEGRLQTRVQSMPKQESPPCKAALQASEFFRTTGSRHTAVLHAFIVKQRPAMKWKWWPSARSETMEQQHDRLSLLGLPAELRLHIYALLFSSTSQALGRLPALFYVNKQIHSEAILLYYQATTFTFWIESFPRTLTMYYKLPERYRTAIQHLRYPTIYPASTTAAAATIPLLQAQGMAEARLIVLPPGFLQVGVRRTRRRINHHEVVWTSDPGALAKEWAEAKAASRVDVCWT